MGWSLFVAAAYSLLLLAVLPSSAPAKDGPPGPDGLPVANPKHPWIILSGDTRVDTLSYAWTEVIPAARRQFEEDNWVIFVENSSAERGEVVTMWKQIHHPLIWLFLGKMMARATVQIRPIGPNRTLVLFRGDLASHHALEGSPMLGAARRAYAKAAHNWRRNVLGDLGVHSRSTQRP